MRYLSTVLERHRPASVRTWPKRQVESQDVLFLSETSAMHLLRQIRKILLERLVFLDLLSNDVLARFHQEAMHRRSDKHDGHDHFKQIETHALPTPLYILTSSLAGMVSSCRVVNSRIRFSRDLLAICPLTWFRLRWDTTA